MNRGPVLVIPAREPGRGGGHLERCLALVRDLRALGREGRLLLPPETAGRYAARIDSSWLISEAELESTAWDWIILDRFRTPPEEYSRWAALAPVIGIDEGGPCRDRFDVLIDILPGLPGRPPPNIADASLLPLAPRLPRGERIREQVEQALRACSKSGILALQTPKFYFAGSKRAQKSGFLRSIDRKNPQFEQALRVLISFGQEDAAGLGLAAAAALAAKNARGLLDITLLRGALDPRRAVPAPEGVRAPGTIPRLGERLAEYDLLVTHYGITAFEALYAGTPVLLIAPGAYHEKLAKAAGFFSAGTGPRAAARLSRLLFQGKALNGVLLNSLETRRAALAARYRLEREPAQNLAGLIKDFTPLIHRACPVCGAPVSGPASGRGPERTFRRCPVCGLIAMNRLSPPPVEYGREYFFEFYQKQYGKTYIEDFPQLMAMGKRRLSIIKSLLPGTGGRPALLDIGCAYGPFLAAAREEGFFPAGVDPAVDAVRYVTRTLGIPAVQGFFPDCPLPEAAAPSPPFDTVTLWYVIEHFQNCAPVFAAIRRILKPGGILAFSTPSFTGISGRSSLARFLERGPEDHWTIWSPRTCKKALALAGFKTRRIVISGRHPERFPFLGRFARNGKSPLYGPLLAASAIFALGDTFEVYAEYRGIPESPLSARL
jgi:2-polyprenyl-3-methyl-5-hydroxy-6-metoxy-1,4-benzoquinol methylase/spore coat polysaccharide biosynthesis predicted glycosyltransferase SpsG